MDRNEIIERISYGEDSYTQFKLNVTNPDKLAGELVAFSNARGGLLIIGVNDEGLVVGLEDNEVRRLNQLIGNVINSNVSPHIYPLVKIEKIDKMKILIVEIDEGANKPYSTNAGIYFTKAGSDKRKISSQELRRLFAESKELYADEEVLKNSDVTDINSELFYRFLKEDNPKILAKLKNGDLVLKTILNNYNLMNGEQLTLAGNLLFGLDSRKYSSSFYVDCCYFIGNDISTTKYRSEKRFYGTFEYLLDSSLNFITSNLSSYQTDNDFNSNGKLEISIEILTELIVNALVHRDYYINSSIKIFMFDNRVEIINPSKLTNSLTIEKIKNGISIQRNPILDSISKHFLSYTGRGTGIKRVLELDPDIDLINDVELEQFKSIIPRKTRVEIDKTRVEIVKFIKQNPSITIKGLTEKLPITQKGVEWQIKKMQTEKIIKRVGPNKGGHWVVISDNV